jgi:hypothetical protein
VAGTPSMSYFMRMLKQARKLPMLNGSEAAQNSA